MPRAHSAGDTTSSPMSKSCGACRGPPPNPPPSTSSVLPSGVISRMRIALADVDGFDQERIARVIDGTGSDSSESSQRESSPCRTALPTRRLAQEQSPARAKRKTPRTARGVAREYGSRRIEMSRRAVPSPPRDVERVPLPLPARPRLPARRSSYSSVSKAAGISTASSGRMKTLTGRAKIVMR